MVGSIDPRCETVRGTHWPKKGREVEVVWSSRRGNHLGQRPKATASTGRTYGCKRSDQTLKKLLWHGGRPHMGPCVRRDDTIILAATLRRQKQKARAYRPGFSKDQRTLPDQAAGLNSFDALALIGSTVSVATFWLNSASSLAWAVRASYCLRA